jgi:hypothetical protein
MLDVSSSNNYGLMQGRNLEKEYKAAGAMHLRLTAFIICDTRALHDRPSDIRSSSFD